MHYIKLVLLLIVGVTSLTYLILFFRYSSSPKNAASLEKILISILFIQTLSGSMVKIIPTLTIESYIQPNELPGFSLPAIYIIAFIVLRSRLRCNLQRFLIGLKCVLYCNPALLALIVLTLLSAFWSETPIFSLARSLVFIGIILVAIYIGSCYEWQEILDLLKWNFKFIVIGSIFVAIAAPSIGVMSKGWSGMLSHAGGLGDCGALTILICSIQLFDKRKHRFFTLGIIPISLLAMVKANSATSFITLIILLILSLELILVRKLKPKLAFIFMFLSMPLTFLGIYILNSNSDNILKFLGKNPDLTGRTEIWAQVIPLIARKPVLGYGFDGFWQPWRGNLNPAASVLNLGGYVAPHAHNGFLDLGLSLGLLGLALFILAYFTCFIYAFQNFLNRKSFGSVLPLTFLISIVLSNLGGTDLWLIGFTPFLFIQIATRTSLDNVRSKIKRTDRYLQERL